MIFFLSHAHAARLSGRADPWVRKFFEDLEAAVHRRAGDGGFYDARLLPGTDQKEQLATAIGSAQVFVPLYSPQYFGNSWAAAELASFRSRLKFLGPAEAARHVVPVVWVPLPPWGSRREIDDAFTAVVKNAEYRANGLRALAMLGVYRESYEELVGAFAERITAVARDYPLEPSPAEPLTPEPTGTDRPVLIVSLISRGDPLRWQFRDHELPVGEYVTQVAARLGVPAAVVPPRELLDRTRNRPCVMLIEAGADPDVVRAAVGGLPRWVIAQVVASASAETSDLTGILRTAGLPAVTPVHTVAEFERNAPLLVTEARKQYLRYGPVVTAPGSPRPSLRRPVDDKRG
ncbi:hypothetical protein Acy02nite_00420 [Actinoplanes cyaneus]|uniref:TIR domain-containing protein n=1 Tax=Actinoplanes cyaneus TaxID=52696 RepID=A0A919IBD4_9ACTN|nr:TIR-like protein FxsC [Actinoplanes cyaneus]MCW2142612.1 TIR domain-containing protein [Actinoplanes cyaneus]GID62161.1 hypothetical protein Acy02nite_00420 [Actinoplanes cyaneus]